MSLTINVTVRGMTEATGYLQNLRNALADRTQLNTQLAMDMREFTQAYLIADERHATAEALGATPTGHRAKIGKSENLIEAQATREAAVLRIPRNTGLGRAFHDVDIKMRDKMLVRAAAAATYGKSPRDFAEGVLKFGIINERFPGLVFAADNAPAFFLMRKVHQKQDRTLLPSDEGYAEAARRSMTAYLTRLLQTAAPAALPA
jgi:hypothetical protein